MNSLSKEIEKRIERVVDVWSKDVADDNDRHETGRLKDEFRAFMDGVVAAAVCPDAPEDLRPQVRQLNGVSAELRSGKFKPAWPK